MRVRRQQQCSLSHRHPSTFPCFSHPLIRLRTIFFSSSTLFGVFQQNLISCSLQLVGNVLFDGTRPSKLLASQVRSGKKHLEVGEAC